MLQSLDEFWAEFRAGLKGWIDPADSTTILYSGGLDSSLVAWAARDLASCQLLVVGLEGSSDLTAARTGAGLLDLPLSVREVSGEELLAARTELGEWIDGPPLGLVPVRLGMALGVRTASSSLVLCGQGADELALGYRHFRGKSDNDLADLAERDWRSLTSVEWPRAQRFAQSIGKKLESPFLLPSFAQKVRDLGVGAHRPRSEAKPWLRALAAHAGLPGALVHRPKRAMQYGTGFDRALRRSSRASARPESPPRP
jgi:asparagine synthase (glutamine-hydrolysing)